MSFLNKINKYYNKNKKNIVGKYKLNNGDYSYKFILDGNNNNIIKLYKNKKPVLDAIYDIAGIYNLYNSVWYWGFNIDRVNRKLVERSKVIKKFPKYIKEHPSEFTNRTRDELLFRTNNGNFHTSIDNIKLLIKLILYLTKSIWYIPICYGKDDTTFVCINNLKKNINLISNNKNNHIERLEYILIKKFIKIY